MNAKYFDYEYITTPGLHLLTYFNQMVYKMNKNLFSFVKKEEYYRFLKNGYHAFKIFHEQFFKNVSDKYENEICIDCSNGLCATVESEIRNIFENDFKVDFINNNIKDYENLNNNSGAEYLHKDKKAPSNQIEVIKNVSFDGDVDRIIY